MKSGKVWSLVCLLLGIIACGIALQSLIVYQSASDSSRNRSYEADRTSGLGRRSLRDESENRYDLAKKAQYQMIISKIIGFLSLVISLILFAGHLATRNKGKNVRVD